MTGVVEFLAYRPVLSLMLILAMAVVLERGLPNTLEGTAIVLLRAAAFLRRRRAAVESHQRMVLQAADQGYWLPAEAGKGVDTRHRSTGDAGVSLKGNAGPDPGGWVRAAGVATGIGSTAPDPDARMGAM